MVTNSKPSDKHGFPDLYTRAIEIVKTLISTTLTYHIQFVRPRLLIYNSGHNSRSMKGVAIMTSKETAIAYKTVDERICLMEIRPSKVARKKLMVLSAPTEDETNENPEKTDGFYSKLECIITINQQKRLSSDRRRLQCPRQAS